MSTRIQWLLELKIKDGGLKSLKALMGDMVQATEKNEPGTLDYQWFISDDNTHCQIFEGYADSQSAMVHLGTFEESYAERFFAILEPTRLTVHGTPSDELRDTLGAFGARILGLFGGFSR